VVSVDLSTRECGGHVLVELRGELDIADAADIAAALTAVGEREIIADLLPATPQQQVLRVLTLTRVSGVVPVHASADEAAGIARGSRQAPAAVRPVRVAVT
jgi:hypothetical protein